MIVTKASAASRFVTGAKPTEQDFADFVDSAIFAPVSGAGGLKTGFIEVVSTAAVTAWSSAGAFPVVAVSATTPITLGQRYTLRVTPEDFGAVGDGVTNDTTALQAFFAHIVAKKAKGDLPGKTYLVNQTIAPAGPFHINCAPGAEIKFSTSGTYTSIVNADAADTGVDVAFDVANCEGSVIQGELRLLSSGSLTNLPTTLAGVTSSGAPKLNFDAQTANFTVGQTITGGTSNATAVIVAITDSGTTGTLTLSTISGTFQNNEPITDPLGGSATVDGTLTISDNSNMTIEALTLAFFGYGLYQPTESASGNYTIYTRSSIRFCIIEFCNVPMELAGANGLDEVWFDTLMIRRCRDRANLVSTQLNCGALFLSGWTSADDETETGSISSGSTSLTLTSAGSWANGDRIIVAGAGVDGPDADSLGDDGGLATVVVSGGGTTTLTLRDAAGATVSGAMLWRNPPISTVVVNNSSSLIVQRLLIENRHYVPIRLTGRPSLFSCASLEIAASSVSSVYGCPIWHASTKGTIEVNCISPGNSDHLVFLAMLRRTSDSNRANRSVVVRIDESLAEHGNNVIRFGQAPSDLYATGTYSDVSSTYTEDTAIIHAGGGSMYRVPPIAGAAPKPMGPSRDDVLEKGGNYTIDRTETATVFINTGASATSTISLPQALKGDRYTFIRTVNQAFRADPNGGNTIGSGGAGKYMELGAVGDAVTIECFVSGAFHVVAAGLNPPTFEP